MKSIADKRRAREQKRKTPAPPPQSRPDLAHLLAELKAARIHWRRTVAEGEEREQFTVRDEAAHRADFDAQTAALERVRAAEGALEAAIRPARAAVIGDALFVSLAEVWEIDEPYQDARTFDPIIPISRVANLPRIGG